ncbi:MULTISPECIES: DUF2626 family protein [Brevibacillus]|uniref:DUF2626 family protein n=1 Tax=Brevibacillus laterosporus TaxID=1465 RepID=A0A518VDX7_BRELA|nr:MULTISPECIES: DUF2626 family protein [Brevibacillus]QOS99503.1 DUF2626 family protein [Brevibacterium sp. JNUCC-42]MDN9012243.1 DUF2626 family protein [Brevibacillus laterosporus]MDO0943339.1 DUF2626 family protein [Brevibacillus laterosporus]OAJ73739.1 hypothetical protein AYJ08_12340 [Brevibacillus sp. SKDU10]QDX95200.1 DUF2626 family protein [Brevibacillus laterosporus]
MDRMFRVLSFWTLMIAIMAFWGKLFPMSLLFFGLTAIFLALGYMRLTERTYLNLFFCFMFVSFVGFTYYTFYGMPPASAGGEHSFLHLLM